MPKILIIEDDIHLRKELIYTLEKNEFEVASITDFTEPELMILQQAPSLVILDLNLPNKSGFEICKWLKSRLDIPILILTSRDFLEDELHALELGADEFLTKPCHPKRLLARVNNLLEMYGKMRRTIIISEYLLDLDTYRILGENTEIILTETEGKILQILLENQTRIVSKEDLLINVWQETEFIDPNILQVNMARLRKKISEIGLENSIETVRGTGYQWREIKNHE